MQDLFKDVGNYEGVFPSGVSFAIRELYTGDQSDLQKRVKKGDRKAFIKMLTGCFLRIGDNTQVTQADVEKTLSNDLAYAFVKLRNHTFRDEKIFHFKNEFPLSPGETKKHIEDFEVEFTPEFFKTKPYKWVVEEMEKLQKEYFKFNPEEKEYKPQHEGEFPIMYNSYDEMLESQKRREFTFPNTETTIQWELLDGSAERIRKSPQFVNKDEITLSLDLRNAVVNRIIKDQSGEEEVPERVEWEKIPMYYSDKFRKEFMDVEGNVDTVITIRSEINPSKIERVNLIQTVAFFVPSLGT